MLGSADIIYRNRRISLVYGSDIAIEAEK